MPVIVDDWQLRRTIRILKAGIRDQRSLYASASRQMRDYIRQTITMQGRGGSWTGLSRWTRRRTGRQKALITLRVQVKARWGNDFGEVIFVNPSSGWDMLQHDRGFTSPAVQRKLMVIPSRDSGILAAFKSRKASKVPARQFIPKGREAQVQIEQSINSWLRNIEVKI